MILGPYREHRTAGQAYADGPPFHESGEDRGGKDLGGVGGSGEASSGAGPGKQLTAWLERAELFVAMISMIVLDRDEFLGCDR